VSRLFAEERSHASRSQALKYFARHRYELKIRKTGITSLIAFRLTLVMRRRKEKSRSKRKRKLRTTANLPE